LRLLAGAICRRSYDSLGRTGQPNSCKNESAVNFLAEIAPSCGVLAVVAWLVWPRGGLHRYREGRAADLRKWLHPWLPPRPPAKRGTVPSIHVLGAPRGEARVLERKWSRWPQFVYPACFVTRRKGEP
jgi:hypothetical protein